MMMRAAVIEDGVVVNVVEADEAFAAEQGWVISETAAIGDLWDGQVFTKPYPTLAAQWERIRSQRNTKLAACDWTQLPDAPVDAAVWATYRQALRDITLQADPFNIVWPTAP